jgi:ATP-dependent DNA helicase RecG
MEMGINKRQLNAVEFVKKNLKISNKEYQILNQISERTASRELADLVNRQILTSSETRGAGSYFYFAGIQ